MRKSIYGLNQAPKAWHERLHSYLINIGFVTTSDNYNLYLKQKIEASLLIIELFVDDIIFGGDYKISTKFVEAMKRDIKMLMVSEIKFFIGLQVSQLKGE